MQKLKSGYTTGTHATAVLVAALYELLKQKNVNRLKVTLPKNIVAYIDVFQESFAHFSTIKGDNDDIDVTKGAKISCIISKDAPKSLKEQMPSLLSIGSSSLHVWAGKGVGVVSKKGLKIMPNYPAINPIPLSMMHENSLNVFGEEGCTLHAVFSVENGEEIAKETANAKVGVLGGISILGTRGIVKPVSSSAYIDSIETEIDVAAALSEELIVFTLGNTAVDFAKELYDATSIVEIGNFIYDASAKLKKHRFKKMVFITSVAKMTKVAQGFKNTHNRFGTIDFDVVREWIEGELHFTLRDEEYLTLKAVLQTLPNDYHEPFVRILTKKSTLVFQKYFKELGIYTKKIELITLPNKIKEELQW